MLLRAGFSRTNPYYVVQQGKVNALCLMKDTDRLELLRSMAGTSLFEEKRQASLRLLGEEKELLDKIETTLGQLQKRVERLEKEKEEVKKWKSKRDEKEAVQRSIYEKEKEKSFS